jgi:predicted ATPase
MAAAFSRALDIAAQRGVTRYQLLALWGLWTERNVFGDYPAALALAERYNAIATATGDPDTRIISDRMLTLSLHFMGDQTAAREHAQRILVHAETDTRPPRLSAFQFDQIAGTQTVLCRILWILGLPEQAGRVAEEGVLRAQTIDHTLSLCFALYAACMVSLWRGDLAAARRYTAMLLQRAQKHTLVFWQAWGRSYDMALMFLQDAKVLAWRNPVCGAQQLEVMATFSERLLEADVLVRAVTGKASWCHAEILRAQGEMMLSKDGTDAAAAAEALFLQALDIARRQQALAWELRSATSLARLWRGQNRIYEAADLLAAVYERFSEGLASADLLQAKQLLDELV